MKAEWLKSGILQLEPESTEDVFKLADFVKSLENDDVKEAPAHLSKTPAQAEQPPLQELPPEYGVILSGSPENPIIENRSGKTVIGYVVMPGALQLLALSVAPSGLHDGDSLYAKGAIPVNSTVSILSPFQSAPRHNRIKVSSVGQGPIVRAILTSVIFGDGQFVGADEHGTFEEFGERIKAITEAGDLAKIGAWDQIEALAQAFAQIPPRIPDREDHIVFSLQGLV